jgi:hypothetical protein
MRQWPTDSSDKAEFHSVTRRHMKPYYRKANAVIETTQIDPVGVTS